MEIKKIKKYKYLIDGHRTLKVIPAKFHHLTVEELSNPIVTESRYYSQAERFFLEHALFLRKLKRKQKFLWELLHDKKVTSARFVHVKFGEDRTELIYDGLLRVKCPEYLFKMYEPKENVKSST